MNISITLHILGGLLIALAIALLGPIPFSLYYQDGALLSYLISSVITAAAGILLFFGFGGSDKELSTREGFAIVTLGWMFFAIFGALPYVLSGSIPHYIDALFESMSGFTTTGSTIIGNLSVIPKSILFWRSKTQWLGGMGIIVLSVAILPFLGAGGMRLFQAEVPGPTKDKLGPRIQNTAKALWIVYFLFTFTEMILLLLGGVGFFDAICHSFTTMATGGFSTYDASISAFDSSYVHWVITFFMLMAGINFTLHYQAITGKPLKYFWDEEFRTFFFTFVVVIIVFVFINRNHYSSLAINIRDAAFQVVSIGTSTGYATYDYEIWPIVTHYVLILLMIIGGCAGSTGGGAKVVRVSIIVKHAIYQIFHLLHPKVVRTLKLNHRPIQDEIIQRTLGFFTLYTSIFFVSSLVISYFDVDLITAASAVIACMSNIGPGLGKVGPTDNFAHFSDLVKLILTFCMLVGRLEIYTVLLIISPSLWKK